MFRVQEFYYSGTDAAAGAAAGAAASASAAASAVCTLPRTSTGARSAPLELRNKVHTAEAAAEAAAAAPAAASVSKKKVISHKNCLVFEK